MEGKNNNYEIERVEYSDVSNNIAYENDRSVIKQVKILIK
jgi:hypothetical protein